MTDKARLEDRFAELSGKTTFSLTCPTAEMAWKYLTDLKLSPSYFNHAYDKCYCSRCCTDTKKTYSSGAGRPVGWTRFSLGVNEHRLGARRVFSDWYKCYHGTSSTALQGIIDCGYLVKAGDVISNGDVLGIRNGHIVASSLRKPAGGGKPYVFDPRQIFVSPSIMYVKSPVYAQHVTWNRMEVTCVLELRIMPDSYTVGPSTLVAKTDDPHLAEDSLEWFTKRYGVHILTGVLVNFATPPPVTTVPRPLRQSLTLSSAELKTKLAILEGKVPFQLDCEYARTCHKFLSQLGINELYFNHAYDMCYCPKCRLKDAYPDQEVFTRGGLPYILPLGYTRFGLYLDTARYDAQKIFEKWPVCYHGTTATALENIIECGFLLVPGDTDFSGHSIELRTNRAGRINDGKADPVQIFTSPSIAYASDPVHAQRTYDSETRYHYSVVLQFRIKPETYKVGGNTLTTPVVDKHTKQTGMEWFTPRHGVHMLYGILVKCWNYRDRA